MTNHARRAFAHCPPCRVSGCDVDYLGVDVISVDDAAECDCRCCHPFTDDTAAAGCGPHCSDDDAGIFHCPCSECHEEAPPRKPRWRHRKPRWHDRARDWLAAAWGRVRGREEWEDAPWCASPWCSVAPEPHPRQPDCPGGDHRDYVGLYPGDELTDDHGNPIGGDLPPVGYEPQVIRTAKVGGVHLPLSGEFVSPWINCAFTPDVPRPGPAPRSGPGYRQNVPRPETGTGGTRQVAERGPGHLTMWDQVEDSSPWKPRPDDTVIIAGPRIAAGRIALLAGA